MNVYIIRHGESENNLKKCWTGWKDAELTKKGYEDARYAGKILGNVSFDRIFSSDLSRACKTAETAIPGCPPETSPLLREINVGSLTDRPYSQTTKEDFAHIDASGYVSFGGESHEEFRARIRTFMKELEAIDCANAAVFTHSGFLRGFRDEVLGLRIPSDKFRCGNCTIGIFDCTKGVWRLHSWISPM